MLGTTASAATGAVGTAATGAVGATTTGAVAAGGAEVAAGAAAAGGAEVAAGAAAAGGAEVAAAAGLTTVLGTKAAGLAAFAGGAAVGYGISQQTSDTKDEYGKDQTNAENYGSKIYNRAPDWLKESMGGMSSGDAQANDDDYKNKLAKENERSKKIKQQKALESAPKVDQQTEDQAKSAETIAKKEAPQQNQTTNINVAPSVSVSQVAATDKAELQKMIEAEVKKFGETIIKIADDRSKARSSGTVNPPQAMQRQMG
jgi:hypothetical protein